MKQEEDVAALNRVYRRTSVKEHIGFTNTENVSYPDVSCDGMERHGSAGRVLLCSSYILLLLSLRRQILRLHFSSERSFASLHGRGLCQRSCGSFTCTGTRSSFTTNLIKPLISSCMLEPSYLASWPGRTQSLSWSS